MEETIISTVNDVKFIENETRMTQSNWQKYFGKLFPSGVIEGLGKYSNNESNHIKDGTAIANGIMAKIETDDGYTAIDVPSGTYDYFVCLRIHFSTEQADLVLKTNIAPEENRQYLTELCKFTQDDSYCCSRTTEYYELPIVYGFTGGYRYINRSWVGKENYENISGTVPMWLLDSHQNWCVGRVTGGSSSGDWRFWFLDNMFPPDNCTIHVTNTTSTSATIGLSQYLFVDGLTASNWSYLKQQQYFWPVVSKYTFQYPSRWTRQNRLVDPYHDNSLSAYFYCRTVAGNEDFRIRVYKYGETTDSTTGLPLISYYIEEI